MRKTLKKLGCITTAAMLCISCLSGCGNKSSENETDTTESTSEAEIEYPTKKAPVVQIDTSDPTDGDIHFRVPDNFNVRNEDTDYGEVITVQYYSTTVGKDRDVSIILPPGYDESKEYPVLYLFHGLGQDNTQWIKDGKADTIIGNMLASGECEEMIIVAPNCRARENDAGNPSDEYSESNFAAFDNFYFEFLTDLKPFIESNYPVKTGRENTALAGFSRGGLISLRLGFGNQDMFGYIGSFNVPADLNNYYIDIYDTDDYISYEHLVLQEEYKDSTYVCLAGGKSDDVVSCPEVYHICMEEYGVSHFFCMYAGGHTFAVADKGFYHFAKELFK